MADLIKPSRRFFLGGAIASLITAPAIVRASSLMPVHAIRDLSFYRNDIVAFIEEFAGFSLQDWQKISLNHMIMSDSKSLKIVSLPLQITFKI